MKNKKCHKILGHLAHSNLPDGVCVTSEPRTFPAGAYSILWANAIVQSPLFDSRARKNMIILNAAQDLLGALDLAKTYLEDGAPNTALRIIQDAISKVENYNV